MREAGGTFSTIADNHLELSILVESLTFGTTYEFVIEARNEYGLSLPSTMLSLLCAFIPDAPLTVTTANIGPDVQVAWSAAVDNGSPITSFSIFIQQRDLTTFTQAPTCVADLEARTCLISLETLKAAPFSLVKAD